MALIRRIAGLALFIGAITAPRAGRRFTKGGLILLGFVVSGLGVVALGGVHHVIALLALTFIGGYGGFVTKVAVDAQIQEALADELRGRAFALYDILYNLATVVAAALVILAEDNSPRGVASNRDEVGEFELSAPAVIVSSGGRSSPSRPSGSP